jgi:hypothetical protein
MTEKLLRRRGNDEIGLIQAKWFDDKFFAAGIAWGKPSSGWTKAMLQKIIIIKNKSI